MDNTVISMYREIYEDGKVDWEENVELNTFMKNLNPPPDKILWMRATAFRIGSEFLSDDDQDQNITLLRSINAIVHAIESNCLCPKEEEVDGVELVDYDEDTVKEFYTTLFDDLSIDREENEELFEFLQTNRPSSSDCYVAMRALAFKTACDFFSEDFDKQHNTNLLRCINCIVHAIEKSYMVPNDFELQLEDDIDMDSMSLNDAIQKLWDLDVNRLTPNVDYIINIQEGKKPYWKEDKAEDPLFQYVDERGIFGSRPTYRTFIALLDNYTSQMGQREIVTNSEEIENWNFIKAIMQTQPMQFVHKYMVHHKPDVIPEDKDEFQQILYNLWFNLYRRTRGDRDYDSSGFEHVFVGEIKDDKVSGFHNWIQFYNEEKKGNVDYRGYIKPKCRSHGETGTNSNDHVLTLQFKWNGIEKFVGSSFIGVSPEFEFALYTLCFILGEESTTNIELCTETDIFDMKITCYRFGHNQIGTSFPEVTAHYEVDDDE